jgi:hypothetical protein
MKWYKLFFGKNGYFTRVCVPAKSIKIQLMLQPIKVHTVNEITRHHILKKQFQNFEFSKSQKDQRSNQKI